MALFWLPGRHWSDPRAQNSIKTNVFLTFRKSLRGPLERLRAAQRRPRGVLLVFARGSGGALGDPGTSDRTPGEPRWGPKGGEQGLRNNKTHIYSGQGFRKKKTLPEATTDTFRPRSRSAGFTEAPRGVFGAPGTLPGTSRTPPWNLARGPGGALGDPEISDRTPWEPRSGPGGVNRVSETTKRVSIQVKVFEKKKRFP